jgi:uncharacterized protein with von Willebrand factor type A (vWA) domain
MLADFFFLLKQAKVPVTTKEYLTLLEALQAGVIGVSMEQFYFLGRICLVKDESHFDRYDKAFGDYFRGASRLDGKLAHEIPEEWVQVFSEQLLCTADQQQIAARGGWSVVLRELQESVDAERRAGGGKLPFAQPAEGDEQQAVRRRKARWSKVGKVWDQRSYRNLDDALELGTRNIKMALRRLRKFAREGANFELDLDDTIRATARNAGYLDLKMVRERHNAMKVLLFLDVGGSMDEYVRICEELFSAVRSEFKHLVHFYFHNFMYDTVWKDNARRQNDRFLTNDILRTYGPDYRLIIVGDATMSESEITSAEASVEQQSSEAGAVWLGRLLQHHKHAVWLNPQPERYWDVYPSIGVVKDLMGQRMFPLTIEGLEHAIDALRK